MTVDSESLKFADLVASQPTQFELPCAIGIDLIIKLNDFANMQFPVFPLPKIAGHKFALAET